MYGASPLSSYPSSEIETIYLPVMSRDPCVKIMNVFGSTLSVPHLKSTPGPPSLTSDEKVLQSTLSILFCRSLNVNFSTSLSQRPKIKSRILNWYPFLYFFSLASMCHLFFNNLLVPGPRRTPPTVVLIVTSSVGPFPYGFSIRNSTPFNSLEFGNKSNTLPSILTDDSRFFHLPFPSSPGLINDCERYTVRGMTLKWCNGVSH